MRDGVAGARERTRSGKASSAEKNEPSGGALQILEGTRKDKEVRGWELEIGEIERDREIWRESGDLVVFATFCIVNVPMVLQQL